ncbi:MAG: hypothetical protein ABI184_07650 [Ginsengibacter sp.]
MELFVGLLHLFDTHCVSAIAEYCLNQKAQNASFILTEKQKARIHVINLHVDDH